ncbi:hypothetical protein C7H19_02690 [Aphanothece hegewaldii CCALA 016]|uniref:Nudix hydrolase domain-containing protein n=1 Tax=Aphanothece hegewaldii CCALA 016 TaxID=2107694 RepID=A0A2T1M2K6_9CHRO|nr:hypothetical protein [Aphanothece hegewaldii]PSF38979.1 hypothetical protein C7H19_02690 [Aphanothece hegewaldii CCALA 016]
MNIQKILLENGIPIHEWDHNKKTKTVAELEQEILCQETKLELLDNQLTRSVKVVNIIVNVQLGDHLFRLIEDKQIFLNFGKVRERNLGYIAEKIIGDEMPETAARRALQEEIGLTLEKELIFIEEEIEQQNSMSYPGLLSIYQIFRYRIILNAADLTILRFSEVQDNKIILFTLEPEN